MRRHRSHPKAGQVKWVKNWCNCGGKSSVLDSRLPARLGCSPMSAVVPTSYPQTSLPTLTPPCCPECSHSFARSTTFWPSPSSDGCWPRAGKGRAEAGQEGFYC